MFRLIKEGCIKGFGILRFNNRELVNVTGALDITQFEFGINLNMSKTCPLHIGFTVGKFTMYIQFFGVQFYENFKE